MRGPFTWSVENESVNAAQAVPYFRIADADDNNVAQCYDKDNAMHITACLNRCWLSEQLGLPTRRTLNRTGPKLIDHNGIFADDIDDIHTRYPNTHGGNP